LNKKKTEKEGGRKGESFCGKKKDPNLPGK